MKVCVPAESDTFDAKVAQHFGKSPYFIFVDSVTMDFEIVKNTANKIDKGAGMQAA